MTKQKVGLVLFWIAVIWAIAWGVVGSIISGITARNVVTMEELNQTMWAFMGPVHMCWGIFGVPVGALVAMIGILLYSGQRDRPYGSMELEAFWRLLSPCRLELSDISIRYLVWVAP